MDNVPETVPVYDVELELAHLNASICAELAAGLSDVEGVREKYGISEAQWEVLKKSQAFRNMLKEAISTFSGEMNAGRRITVKAEVALEDSIPVLYQIAHNPETNPANRVDAVKMMAQLAGRNQKEAAGSGGGGGFNVTIEINTGESRSAPVTIEGTTSTPEE